METEQQAAAINCEGTITSKEDVWWDFKSVIYYELLPSGRTIDSTVYCSQLTKLDQAIRTKRPELVNRKGVVFHHDNAKSHTLLVIRNKLLRLGWDVLPYLAYLADLASSNYHLFISLQNSLNGKTFNNEKADKPQMFYERGIMKLVGRWQKVIDKNGQYIIH